jgi:hypothetical protein
MDSFDRVRALIIFNAAAICLALLMNKACGPACEVFGNCPPTDCTQKGGE